MCLLCLLLSLGIVSSSSCTLQPELELRSLWGWGMRHRTDGLVLSDRAVITTGIGSLVWEDSDRGQHPPGDARSWWAQHYRFYACATQIASFPIFSASNFYLLRSPGDSDTKHSECSLGLPPIV